MKCTKRTCPKSVSTIKYHTVVYMLLEAMRLQHTACKEIVGLGDKDRLWVSPEPLLPDAVPRALLCH